MATLRWNIGNLGPGSGARFDIHLSRDGLAGPYETIVTNLADTGSYDWTVTGPATSGPKAHLRVVVELPTRPIVNSDDFSDGGVRIRQ